MATPFKMKNSMLKKSAKTGSPIYKNYGTPMKDRKDPGLPNEGGNINWGTVDAAKAHNKKHNQGLGPDHKVEKTEKPAPTKHTISIGPEKGTQAPTKRGVDAHNSAHASGQFVDNAHNTKESLKNKKMAEKKAKGSSPAALKSPAKQTKKQQSQIDKEKEIKSKHYDMHGKKSLKEGSVEYGELKKAIKESRRQSIKDSKKKK
tara:strand:+ start:227 stop:835 length:609 start_codon:yes stop_codon:yes gene_type:complete